MRAFALVLLASLLASCSVAKLRVPPPPPRLGDEFWRGLLDDLPPPKKETSP